MTFLSGQTQFVNFCNFGVRYELAVLYRFDYLERMVNFGRHWAPRSSGFSPEFRDFLVN